MKIEFDPFDYKETSAVLQIAKNNCPSAFQMMTSTNGISSPKGGAGYQDLMNDYLKFKEKSEALELQLDQLKKENEKKDRIIQNQTKEIETRQLEINSLNEKYEDEKGYFQLAQKDFEKKESDLNAALNKKDDDYRKLQRDLNNQNLVLKNKVKELQRQIEKYIPSIEGASGEIKYFQVEGNKLVETNSDDAYYKAQVGLDRVCIFQFNCEKGHAKEACSKKDSLLFPFCDIIDENPNANNIAPGKWGEAIITDSGELDVKLKAQIRLTKI